jgi:hypothetical protein
MEGGFAFGGDSDRPLRKDERAAFRTPGETGIQFLGIKEIKTRLPLSEAW